MKAVAILGAAGYTGRLVVERAREERLKLRLVGRSRDLLEDVAGPGEEVEVADARDQAALTRAFEGCSSVISLAGPFLANGTSPVAAAIAAQADYLDSSGEQAWARLLFERFGDQAARAEVAVLPCFGFDYVPGDLAARLAAEGLEPLDEVIVAYSVTDAVTSRGTRRTIGRVLAQPQVAFEDGRLAESRFGKTVQRVRFPTGVHTVVEWTGTEPLTVPRHTDVRNVRSYVRGLRIARLAGRIAPLAAPLVGLMGRVGRLGPRAGSRERTSFAVVAEASGPAGGRRVTLTGTDPYALTALLLVRGASLAPATAGVLAPAEAFDAEALVAALEPLLGLSSREDF